MADTVMQDKAAIWDQIREDVKLMIDKLNKPIDEEIIEAVTAFRAFEFPTAASCEGHFEYGCPYPWIDVEVPTSGKRPHTVEEKENLERQRLQLESKMIDLFEDFYSNRHIPYHAMLTIQSLTVDYFRVRSVGGDVSEVLGWGRCYERLKFYKAEMEAFTIYLKAKFLNG
jgi:hypothetical protein